MAYLRSKARLDALENRVLELRAEARLEALENLVLRLKTESIGVRGKIFDKQDDEEETPHPTHKETDNQMDKGKLDHQIVKEEFSSDGEFSIDGDDQGIEEPRGAVTEFEHEDFDGVYFTGAAKLHIMEGKPKSIEEPMIPSIPEVMRKNTITHGIVVQNTLGLRGSNAENTWVEGEGTKKGKIGLNEKKHVPGRLKSLGTDGREAIGWMARADHQVENQSNSLLGIGASREERRIAGLQTVELVAGATEEWALVEDWNLGYILNRHGSEFDGTGEETLSWVRNHGPIKVMKVEELSFNGEELTLKEGMCDRIHIAIGLDWNGFVSNWPNNYSMDWAKSKLALSLSEASPYTKRNTNREVRNTLWSPRLTQGWMQNTRAAVSQKGIEEREGKGSWLKEFEKKMAVQRQEEDREEESRTERVTKFMRQKEDREEESETERVTKFMRQGDTHRRNHVKNVKKMGPALRKSSIIFTAAMEVGLLSSISWPCYFYFTVFEFRTQKDIKSWQLLLHTVGLLGRCAGGVHYSSFMFLLIKEEDDALGPELNKLFPSLSLEDKANFEDGGIVTDPIDQASPKEGPSPYRKRIRRI